MATVLCVSRKRDNCCLFLHASVWSAIAIPTPSARHAMLRQDQQKLVMQPNDFVELLMNLPPALEVIRANYHRSSSPASRHITDRPTPDL
jgi:hypothetical protein